MYDQWLLFCQGRMSAYVWRIVHLSACGGWIATSCLHRVYCLIKRASWWDWNHEMIRNPDIIPLLLDVSAQLREEGLHYFIPDPRQLVLRYAIQSVKRSHELNTFRKLFNYPGIDPTAGFDRLAEFDTGVITVYDIETTPPTSFNLPVDNYYHFISVLERPRVIGEHTYHECFCGGDNVYGYLREPSSALSIMAINNDCNRVLMYALHPLVPLDVRQQYYKRFWNGFAVTYQRMYVEQMHANAIAAGVVFRDSTKRLQNYITDF
jgi:hypothetical protein